MHPNAGLRDIDLSAEDRFKILSADYGPSKLVPKRDRVIEVYGDPTGGNPKATKPSFAWEARFMTALRRLPGAWNNADEPDEPKLYVHTFMAPYLLEALTRLDDAGLIHEIETIGCLNFRRMRHSKDPEVDLSYHSWGVALDINATKNFGVYHKTKFQSSRHRPVGAPWSKDWKAIWPHGLSEEVVTAFESVGFRWGGRWKGYVDPMHFELVAR
jgi:hypothetical protein